MILSIFIYILFHIKKKEDSKDLFDLTLYIVLFNLFSIIIIKNRVFIQVTKQIGFGQYSIVFKYRFKFY